MTENATNITVTRTIDAPAKEIFDLLSLPERHHEFDGSGMVRSDDKSDRIQAVGEVFVMNMHAEHMGGDYQTYNHVTAFHRDKMVGWQPAPEKNKDNPDGWEWLYELRPLSADSTEVTLTYDWSKIDDEKLASIFPLVSEAELDDSLNQLAAAVSGS